MLPFAIDLPTNANIAANEQKADSALNPDRAMACRTSMSVGGEWYSIISSNIDSFTRGTPVLATRKLRGFVRFDRPAAALLLGGTT